MQAAQSPELKGKIQMMKRDYTDPLSMVGITRIDEQWQVRAWDHNRKRIHVGSFADLREAIDARVKFASNPTKRISLHMDDPMLDYQGQLPARKAVLGRPVGGSNKLAARETPELAPTEGFPVSARKTTMGAGKRLKPVAVAPNPLWSAWGSNKV